MIPTLPFGSTGHISTRTIFGAAALSRATQEEADRVLELLLRHGVNHIDVAASYGDAELRVGPWMAEHRSRFFLATKTGDRTYKDAKVSIERSLERLRVPQLDLIQLHNLSDTIQWQTAMGPGGALEACIEAKQKGLVRFIGITGHNTSIAASHLRSLDRYPIDSVLLPWNYLMSRNPYYRESFDELVTRCQQRGVAVQTIKSISIGLWLDKERTHRTWYEPLSEQADIDKAVNWLLGRPGIFLNTAGDISLLPKVLEAASRFSGAAPSDAEMGDLVEARKMTPLFV